MHRCVNQTYLSFRMSHEALSMSERVTNQFICESPNEFCNYSPKFVAFSSDRCGANQPTSVGQVYFQTNTRTKYNSPTGICAFHLR
jgi:hypothetical protein